ncbi:amidase [Micrococcus sp. IITD107]|uniref:amidase n=1 Tax=Micrococcus sp. IITD107 TaxID=3342790 RepID=UPI0035B9CC27
MSGSVDLSGLTAVELTAALASGEVSARDAVEHVLQVTERENPRLGAFLSVAPVLARQRAAALDERFAQDGPTGRLHGLPTAFKDLTDVAGMRTTFGSRIAQDAEPADQDDALAATVHGAGAVSVGKTNVPEFGLPCHTENLIAPPTRNPLDPARTAGGSSGGAAAAVASGMLPVAPGNDGGGSVRIPAAACGLVGFKPGRNVVPADRAAAQMTAQLGGPEAGSVRNLTCSGPLARTVEDAGLLLDAMLGAEWSGPGDRGPLQTAAVDADPGRLSVGVSTESPFAPDLEITLAPAAVSAVTAAATALAHAGHEVSEVEVGFQPGYHRMFRTVWTSALARIPLPQEAETLLGPLAANFLELVRGYSEDQVTEAVAGLEAWAADARGRLDAVDVVMTPVLAFAPPPIGTFTALPPAEDYELQCRFTPYTSMVNVMGLPAVSVPVLRDEGGLSWSVQLIGREGTEVQLTALAAQLEGLLAGRG